MKIEIVPTVFVRDVVELQGRLELYEAVVKRVQLDIADEEFATQPTLGVEQMVKQATTMQRDVHLMTAEPIDWLEICAEGGVEMVIGHVENMGNQKEFVEEARRLGLKPGLAVDLETGLEGLDWPVAKTVDQLLVMAVRAGKEAQKLSQKGLEKVKKLRKKGFEKEICVDGGVNEATIARCVKAGADVLAIGSGLWKAEKVKQEYERLREVAERASKS
jgi:ribulose-phosphate 3-epimerase